MSKENMFTIIQYGCHVTGGDIITIVLLFDEVSTKEQTPIDTISRSVKNS
jgi:hypothetical protein